MGMSPRLLRPRATGFSPKSIAGLAGWWDVSSGVTLNGSTISVIPDRSGNGRNFTQPAGATIQPTYVAAGQNGLATASFDGTRWMSVPSSTSAFAFAHQATGATIYIVASPASTTSNAFLIGNNASSPGLHGFNFCTNNSSNARRFQANVTNGAANVFFGQFDQTFSALPAWAVVGVVLDPSNATTLSRCLVYRDGTHKTATYNGSSAPAVPSSSNAYSNLTLGTMTEGGGFPYQGSVGEILIYSGIHATSTRQTIERYLKKKWGTP